jgi:hypothetical protein
LETFRIIYSHESWPSVSDLHTIAHKRNVNAKFACTRCYNSGRVAHCLKSKKLARTRHAILYQVNWYWILTNKCRNKLKQENEAKRCHGFRVCLFPHLIVIIQKSFLCMCWRRMFCFSDHTPWGNLFHVRS